MEIEYMKVTVHIISRKERCYEKIYIHFAHVLDACFDRFGFGCQF